MEQLEMEKEDTPRKDIGICAECYFFTKKGDQRNCENENSDHYGRPVHSIQDACDCFEAYWW